MELAKNHPGFLGVEATGDDDLSIAVSYWESDETIRAFKELAEQSGDTEAGAGYLLSELQDAYRKGGARLRLQCLARASMRAMRGMATSTAAAAMVQKAMSMVASKKKPCGNMAMR